MRHALSERHWWRGQREALEAAVNGAALQTSLGALARTVIDALGRDIRAAFYLTNREGTSLHHVVGMPADYAEAVDGFRIGPESLACGLAMHSGQPVLTSDVTKEKRWESWQWLAERFDFRGCWSFPLSTSAGKFIGTLAVYSRQPREATDSDLELVSLMSQTASVIISQHLESEARKRAEEEVQQSRNDLDRAQEVGRIGSWRLVVRHNVLTWSAENHRIFGVPVGTPLSYESFLSIVHPDDREYVDAQWQAGLRGVPYDIEHRIVADGRVKWVREKAYLEYDAAGALLGGFGITQDISERKQAEEALREADRRKDEFLATLAHELRNPLAPIHNAVHVLKKKSGLREQDAALLDMIQRQTDHLVRLVDELLEVSRITRGKIELRKESVAVSSFLRDALETCQPLIDKKGHRLNMNVAPEPLWVTGDPVRLAQITANLVSNAAKYTQPGGLIDIDVAIEGNKIVLRVRDNGVGIPADMLPRVFDLFTQIENQGGFSDGRIGIGLALASKLIELHGGRIDARSAGVGRGSEFVVWLPIGKEPEAEAARKSVTTDDGKTLRALVIDNEHDAGDSFGLLLVSLGVAVRVVYDGLSGVGVMDEFEPDLVFVDIGMPVVDGYETARRLREGAHGHPFILVALTGWGQEKDRRRAEEAGFDVHLTKPASIEVIEALLRRARST